MGLFLGTMALLMTYLFFALNFLNVFIQGNLHNIYNHLQIILWPFFAHQFTLGDACNELVMNLIIVLSTALTGGVIAYLRDC